MKTIAEWSKMLHGVYREDVHDLVLAMREEAQQLAEQGGNRLLIVRRVDFAVFEPPMQGIAHGCTGRSHDIAGRKAVFEHEMMFALFQTVRDPLWYFWELERELTGWFQKQVRWVRTGRTWRPKSWNDFEIVESYEIENRLRHLKE